MTHPKAYLVDLVGWDDLLLVSFHDLAEARTALETINRAGTHHATFWTRTQVETASRFVLLL